MPIKDKSLYPKNWTIIRFEILERAGKRCECDGRCRRAHVGRCREIDRKPARTFRGRVILTTAHLNQNTRDNRRSNLAALCQACHLGYDRPHNVIRSMATRDRKRGQLRFRFAEFADALLRRPAGVLV
jgi:hypothetical protein